MVFGFGKKIDRASFKGEKPQPVDGFDQPQHQSCLTDIPVYFADEDKLNSTQYARALSKFICNADTPVTLGIQGGWGSGKTSMFSLLRSLLEEPKPTDRHGNENKNYEQELKDYSENPTVCITINAWEHSLFQSEANKAAVVLSILSSMVNNIIALGKTGLLDSESNKQLIETNNPVTIVDTMRKFMPTLVNVGMQFLVPGAGAVMAAKSEGKTQKEEPKLPVLAEQIHDLKEKLGNFVQCLKYHGNAAKVVIFIDDLDRVPPPTAVEILDVTKNIFDIKNCVFVLAIDYDVIVKGLEKKFGARNKTNEREFRQYFDKIIQIPFTMPIGAFSKQIDKMLSNALARLDYKFEKKDEEKILNTLAKACRLATGGLPRSLKRIVNTFSLLDYIANEKNAESNQFDKRVHLEARFIIVALHINYPEIFRCIMERPNFTQWKLQELEIPWELDLEANESQLESLAHSRVQNYFDEDWEKIVFCLCSQSDWLKHNAINISRLMNQLRDVLMQPEEQDEEHTGEARDLSDSAVEILRQLIDSIRVISIDSELQAGEIGGNAAQKRIFTNFCQHLATKLKDELFLKAEQNPEEINAQLNDESNWFWEMEINEDVRLLTCYWDSEEKIFFMDWDATRHGLLKAESEKLLSAEITRPFDYGTYGDGKNATFFVRFKDECFEQKDFFQDKTVKKFTKLAVEAYKLAQKMTKKMKKMTE